MQNQTTTWTRSVLNWLRAGYPEGIPARDYAAILGVLNRKLTHEEIKTISAELAQQASADSPISRADIEAMISERVLQQASPEDVMRVSARLAAGGWPLADPHSD
jgi:hypothetical protein